VSEATPRASADAYDRGRTDGGIAERLAGHDRQLDAINGSLEGMAREMHELTLAVQRLGDQAAALAATNAALVSAEAARRATSDRSWTPFARVIASVGGAAALVAIFAWVDSHW
jgi:hypothetical protein